LHISENSVSVLLTLYDRFTFSAVAYATVSVDSFFVLRYVVTNVLIIKIAR